MHEVDLADYNESAGLGDKAVINRKEAFNRALEASKAITQAQVHREQNIATMAGHAITTGTTQKGAMDREKEQTKRAITTEKIRAEASTKQDKLAFQETQAAYRMFKDWKTSDAGKKLDDYETARSLDPKKFDEGKLKADYDRLKAEERHIREMAAEAYRRSNLPLPPDLAGVSSPSASTSVTVGGKTYNFPDAKSAEAFKKDAGVK